MTTLVIPQEDPMGLAPTLGLPHDKGAYRYAYSADGTSGPVAEDEEPEDRGLEEEPVDPGKCPMCNGPAVYLGRLGHLHWFRCRNCGWEWEVAK